MPLTTTRRTAAVFLLAAVLVSACGSATHTGSAFTTTASTTAVPTFTTPPGPPMSTSPPPWPLPNDSGSYIRAAGLEALSTETLAVHYHAHLDIIVNGQPVTVPPGIGFVFTNGAPTALSSLHTHDTSGIIHIESPVDKPFTLGQVFAEWGVMLDSTQMGGLRTGGGDELRLYVNGKLQTTAPQHLVLRPHQEIVLWFGPSGQHPSVPSSYSFPAGD